MNLQTGRGRGAALAVRARWLALGAVLAVLSACGGGGGGGGEVAPVPPADPGVAGASYFTVAVGDRWRSQEGTTTLTTRVVREESGGFVLREDSSAGSTDESLLVRNESAVSIVPLPASDPLTAAIGRYDLARFPLRAGASFTSVDKAINGVFDFDGDGRLDNLQLRIVVTVVGFERVTVPAGSFDNALHQRTVITQTIALAGSARTLVVTGTADDWYAVGVGPVKSVTVVEGPGPRESTEEVLLDYRVGSQRSDTVAPTVGIRTPADGSTVNAVNVQLVFSEAIERVGRPADTLVVRSASGQVVPGRSEWAGARTLVFLPDGGGLFPSGRYSVSLSGVPEDFGGNRLEGSVQWAFDVDRNGPVLVTQTPAPGAQDVPLDTRLAFTFDEDLPPTTATTATVMLSGPGGPVPVVVTVQGRVLQVTPARALQYGQFHLVSVSGVQDRLGNQAPSSISSSFTTTRGEPGRYAFPEPLPAFGGRQVELVRLGDVNGDGRADLLASAANAERSAYNPVVVLRNADGSLAAQATALPNPNCSPQDLSFIDLDADGLTDVLGARSFCGAFWVQQTAGTAWRYGGGLGFSAEQLRAIRLVGQVRPGIVVLGNFDPSLRLLRPQGGAGTTAFEPAELLFDSVNTALRVLQVADVNGDGREDVVMATGRNGQILLALQRADASFELQSFNVPGVEHVWLVADLNGDGRADLLLGEANPSLALVVLLQQADGSLARSGLRYVLPARTSHALRADVDGDGRPEIVLAVGPDASTVENLAVFTPRADGSFALLPLLQYPSLPRWSAAFPGTPIFAVGDFSGDGWVDLLQGGELIRARAPVVVPQASRGSDLRALPLRGAAFRGWAP